MFSPGKDVTKKKNNPIDKFNKLDLSISMNKDDEDVYELKPIDFEQDLYE